MEKRNVYRELSGWKAEINGVVIATGDGYPVEFVYTDPDFNPVNITLYGIPLATEEPTVTAEPTAEPTEEPTTEPTLEPTEEPTTEPTAQPTEEPTTEPTAQPTEEPTLEPTAQPTEEPTTEPTAQPTEEPTLETTAQPTEEPDIDTEPEIYTQVNSGVITVELSHKDKVPVDSKVYAAIYKDGRLVSLRAADVAYSEQTSEVISLGIPDTDYDKIEVLWWDTGYRPICRNVWVY